MKHAKRFAFLGLAGMLLLFACKKADLKSPQQAGMPDKFQLPEIIAARSFFENKILSANFVFNGMPDERQRLKKTADWDNAYIIYHPKGDIVSVPLRYEKRMNFEPSFGDGNKISLDKQSKLLVYKDKHGSFKAEVVTYIPDKEYTGRRTAKFSGIVIVEDWASNPVNKYLFKDGEIFKIAKLSASGSGGKVAEVTCTRIHWYICDVDESGNTSNCVYQYTQEIGTCNNEGLEPPGEGGIYEYDDYEVGRTVTWTVATNPNPQATGEVVSVERIKGRRVASEPQGGHFTNIVHYWSACNFCSINEPKNVWTESTNVILASGQIASSYVRGRLQYEESVGYPENTKTWFFSEVFP